MAETEKEGRPPENKRSRKPAHPVKREINEEMKVKKKGGGGGVKGFPAVCDCACESRVACVCVCVCFEASSLRHIHPRDVGHSSRTFISDFCPRLLSSTPRGSRAPRQRRRAQWMRHPSAASALLRSFGSMRSRCCHTFGVCLGCLRSLARSLWKIQCVSEGVNSGSTITINTVIARRRATSLRPR